MIEVNRHCLQWTAPGDRLSNAPHKLYDVCFHLKHEIDEKEYDLNELTERYLWNKAEILHSIYADVALGVETNQILN